MSGGEVGGSEKQAPGAAKGPRGAARTFRQVMDQRRPALVTALVDRTLNSVPFAIEGGEAMLAPLLDASVGLWLDAAEATGQGALKAQVEVWCMAFRGQGADAATVLELLEATARALLDVALDAVEEGALGAEDGARGLLDALAQANDTYDRAFRLTAEEEAEKAVILRAVAENAPDAIGIARPDGRVTYMNPAFVTLVGQEPQENTMLFDYVHPDDLPKVHQMAVVSRDTGGKVDGTLRYLRPDGTIVKAHVSAFRVADERGEVIARCGLIRDLTDEERIGDERRALEEQILDVQAEALKELGAPMMPLAEGVVAMPLVGTIDVTRAERILEVMLDGIMQTGAGHVIIDITGVPVVDAEVADAIARASKAAQLVGTEVVITGIRGAVARTIVDLGVDLGGVDTWSTLEQGVAHAIGHERQKKARRGKTR